MSKPGDIERAFASATGDYHVEEWDDDKRKKVIVGALVNAARFCEIVAVVDPRPDLNTGILVRSGDERSPLDI